MPTDPLPKVIYFVQKPAEYLSFVGYLLRLAVLGQTLGIDILSVGKRLPDNAPAFLAQPGLWVEYSDGSCQRVQAQ